MDETDASGLYIQFCIYIVRRRYLGDGLGNFSADNVIGIPGDNYGLAPVAPGDIDGDGLDDVARIGAGGFPEAYRSDAPTVDVVIFRNESSGLTPVSSASRLRLADMNGDGRPEMVVLGAGVITIFRQVADAPPWSWQQVGDAQFIGRAGVALATPRDLNHDGAFSIHTTAFVGILCRRLLVSCSVVK